MEQKFKNFRLFSSLILLMMGLLVVGFLNPHRMHVSLYENSELECCSLENSPVSQEVDGVWGPFFISKFFVSAILLLFFASPSFRHLSFYSSPPCGLFLRKRNRGVLQLE